MRGEIGFGITHCYIERDNTRLQEAYGQKSTCRPEPDHLGRQAQSSESPLTQAPDASRLQTLVDIEYQANYPLNGFSCQLDH